MKKFLICLSFNLVGTALFSQDYIARQPIWLEQTTPTLFNAGDDHFVSFRTIKTNGQYHILYEMIDKTSGAIIHTKKLEHSSDVIILSKGYDMEPENENGELWLTGAFGDPGAFRPFVMQVNKQDGTVSDAYEFYVDGYDHVVGLDVEIEDNAGYLVGAAFENSDMDYSSGYALKFDVSSGGVIWTTIVNSTEANNDKDRLLTLTIDRVTGEESIYVGGSINKSQNNFPSVRNGTYYIATLNKNDGSLIAEAQYADWGHYPSSSTILPNSHYSTINDIKISNDGSVYAIGWSSIAHANTLFNFDVNLNYNNHVCWPISSNSTLNGVQWLYEDDQTSLLVTGLDMGLQEFYVSSVDINGLQWTYRRSLNFDPMGLMGFEPNNIFGSAYIQYGGSNNPHHLSQSLINVNGHAFLAHLENDRNQLPQNEVVYHSFDIGNISTNNCYEWRADIPHTYYVYEEQTSVVTEHEGHSSSLSITDNDGYSFNSLFCGEVSDGRKSATTALNTKEDWENGNFEQVYTAYDVQGKIVGSSANIDELIKRLKFSGHNLYVITNANSPQSDHPDFKVVSKKYVLGN